MNTSPPSRTIEVLLVIEQDIATTQLVERVLEGCAALGLTYRKQYLSRLHADDFHDGTVTLFVRCGDPLVEYWVTLLESCGFSYLYYVDDNFWRIEGDSPLARYYQHPVIRRSLNLIVRRAASVLTNSEELAEFLRGLNPDVRILAAFFDFSLLQDGIGRCESEIRIGFAGSPSRVADLDIVKPAIEQVLAAVPRAVFEFAGTLPRGVAPGDRIRFFEHVSSYEEFIRFQQGRGWAIGLAPLRDIDANRCKTNNKYREYGACSIAGIYSDLPVYRRSVDDGATGLLVDNAPASWTSAILHLVGDPKYCREVGERACEDVRDKHCVTHVAQQWFEAIGEVRSGMVVRSCPISPRMVLKIRYAWVRSALGFLWMQVTATYFEGGVPLVLKRSAGRLGAALRGILR